MEFEAQDSRMLVGVRPTLKQAAEVIATGYAPSLIEPGNPAGLAVSGAGVLRG
jgi:hypothetical protein